jgi:erythromycin esterase
MGFTAVALETGFTESGSVERFVAGGPGELRSIARDGMTHGFGQLSENEELIQWIRDYNSKTAHLRKVWFYGIDMSGVGRGTFEDSRRAVEPVLAYLARVDSVAASRIRDALEPILERFSQANYPGLSSTERERLALALAEAASALKRKRSSLVRMGSDEEYQWALHNVVVAQQLNLYFEASLEPLARGPGPGIPPGYYRLMNARDVAMAENVRWALEREGPNGRLVVFAHNGHVMNSVLQGGIWSTLQQPPSA